MFDYDVPLHPVQHDMAGGLWCGVAAVSAITGAPTSEVRAVIKRYKNRRGDWSPIKGTTTAELKHAIGELGFHMGQGWKPASDNTPLTLARWLRERKPETRARTILVNVTDHWMVVRNKKGLCSMTGREPVWTSQLKNRRAWVRGWHHISRIV